MKRISIIAVSSLLLAAVWWHLAHRDQAELKRIAAPNQDDGHRPPLQEPAAPSNPNTPNLTPIQRATSAQTGDAHSLAVSALVYLAKKQQPLAAADKQTLLSFIRGPQPEGLSDGEWEERKRSTGGH